MQRSAPTGRFTQHGREREIEKRRSPYGTCFAPIEMRMGQDNSEAANEQSEKAQREDPVSDADQRRVAERAWNVQLLDCDPRSISEPRHGSGRIPQKTAVCRGRIIRLPQRSSP